MGLGRKMCTWRKRKSANFFVNISYVNGKIAGFLLHRWSPSITGSIATLPSSEQGGVSIREQWSRARSRRGGVSENQIASATEARLTAVAIAIATRPFKFHEISVSNTSSSFVSSIHSSALNALRGVRVLKTYAFIEGRYWSIGLTEQIMLHKLVPHG